MYDWRKAKNWKSNILLNWYQELLCDKFDHNGSIVDSDVDSAVSEFDGDNFETALTMIIQMTFLL